MRVGVVARQNYLTSLKNKAVPGDAIGQRQHRKHAAGGFSYSTGA